MFEIPVDFVVTYKFKHYKLVEDFASCDGCAFREMNPNCPNAVVGECDLRKRKDGLSVKFVEVGKPTTTEIRNMRLVLADHCCEYCGKPVSGLDEHLHHVIDTNEARRTAYEALLTTRILCYACHEGVNKGTVLMHYRKEVDAWLLLQYAQQEVMKITGKGIRF